MQKVNWGLIGLGSIAFKFASAFKYSQNSKLIAISSLNKEKLNLFKESFNIEDKYCFNEYEEILQCEEIDVIYIALPHSMHAEWSIKAAKYKKNILVEKPAAMNLNEINLILKSVKESGVFFMEGFMYRCHPQINKVISILNENKIGSLNFIESNFGYDLLGGKSFFGIRIKKPNPKRRVFNKELGGGAIFDMGCYPLSMSRLIAGIANKNLTEPQLKSAKGIIGKTNVDEISSANLKFSNDLSADIETSITKKMTNKTCIYGSKGKIIINDPWQPGKKSTIEVQSDNKINYIETETKKDLFTHEIDLVSSCIIDGIKEAPYPAPTYKDTIENTNLLNQWLNKII